MRELVAQGRRGRKSSAGFYKKTPAELLVYDVKTRDYRSQEKCALLIPSGAIKNEEDPKKRLKKLVFAEDVAGKFAWALLAKTLIYSARRLGEIADDIVSIDQAMRWGFNWDLGPFEAWDAIGVPESVATHEAGRPRGSGVGRKHARFGACQLLRGWAGSTKRPTSTKKTRREPP